jgi:hypothetical protein
MSVSSTIPTVKARILELMAERVGLAEVQRTYSHPGKLLERESICFLNPENIVHEIRAMKAGHKPRDESYDLVMLVYVHRVGASQEETEARAFDLLAEIEDLLADDATLGIVPEIHWARFGGITELDTGAMDKGNATAIVFKVSVRARLD